MLLGYRASHCFKLLHESQTHRCNSWTSSTKPLCAQVVSLLVVGWRTMCPPPITANTVPSAGSHVIGCKQCGNPTAACLWLFPPMSRDVGNCLKASWPGTAMIQSHRIASGSFLKASEYVRPPQTRANMLMNSWPPVLENKTQI